MLASYAGSKRVTVPVAVLVFFFSLINAAIAQSVVTMPKMVVQPKHTEYVYTQNPFPNIIDVKSSNPSVATANPYRADRVQIIGVAPGRTDVQFFDSTQRVLYQVPVWVEQPNASGGGGAGYNSQKIQLSQVVMPVKHTHNVAAPGTGSHQLSSVVSSNPSVATARTNTANTIQIYSLALGDTFVDFTDNATGKNYQVHVWVVKNASQPSGGTPSGGGAGPQGSGPKPFPTPTKPVVKLPKGPAVGGPFDSCLCGTWRSESVVNNFIHWDNGGSGIILKVKGDGHVDIDYSSMQPYRGPRQTIDWKGNASGRIATQSGSLSVVGVDSSNVTIHYTRPDAPPYSNNLAGLGNVLQTPITYTYTCDQTTLSLKSHVFSTVFKKVSND